jgi:hypothetical protein
MPRGRRFQPANRAKRVAHVERTYGVPRDALERLELYQWVAAGRDPELWEPGMTVCWGCQRATGASKNLAMDHNHRSGEARMLLCATCNHKVLGHFRDDPAGLIRLAFGLISPPSREAWTGLGLAPPTWHTDKAEILYWVETWLDIRGH